MTTMARIVINGDLMTDTVAHATLPLARGSDTPAKVTTHGGGSGANVAAWGAADGADVAFIGRRGADLAGRNRDLRGDGHAQGRAHHALRPRRQRRAGPGGPAARPVHPRRAPARFRVHAAHRGIARVGPGRARLRA